MLPHECIHSAIPILHFEEGEQLVMGYALPPFVDMVLDVRGASKRVLEPDDRVVAEIYCQRETHQLFFEPYVNSTRILMDYEEVTNTKRIKISPGTLFTFGREPFETSFIVTADDSVSEATDYQVGSTDNPIPMPSPLTHSETPKVEKRRVKKNVGVDGTAIVEKKAVCQGSKPKDVHPRPAGDRTGCKAVVGQKKKMPTKKKVKG